MFLASFHSPFLLLSLTYPLLPSPCVFMIKFFTGSPVSLLTPHALVLLLSPDSLLNSLLLFPQCHVSCSTLFSLSQHSFLLSSHSPLTSPSVSWAFIWFSIPLLSTLYLLLYSLTHVLHPSFLCFSSKSSLISLLLSSPHAPFLILIFPAPLLNSSLIFSTLRLFHFSNSLPPRFLS